MHSSTAFSIAQVASAIACQGWAARSAWRAKTQAVVVESVTRDLEAFADRGDVDEHSLAEVAVALEFVVSVLVASPLDALTA